MAELGQTTDPKALIPGDPPAVYENARVLEARASSAGAVGDALKRIDTGGWRGPASDRFHEDHQTEVPRWMQADDSLDNAAQALTAYADTLAWAQGQAAEAIAQWQRGDTATEQAEQAYDRAVADAQTRTRANAERGDPTVVQPPAFTDPGEAHRQAARDILKRARRQLAEAGDRCTEALRVEASLAPQDSRRQADANFYGGIRDSISGAGEALWGAISDPGGTVAAMAHNVMHPVETFKAITAWDDWPTATATAPSARSPAACSWASGRENSSKTWPGGNITTRTHRPNIVPAPPPAHPKPGLREFSRASRTIVAICSGWRTAKEYASSTRRSSTKSGNTSTTTSAHRPRFMKHRKELWNSGRSALTPSSRSSTEHTAVQGAPLLTLTACQALT
ncbi:putative T7SS-secreted protein [Amycolatopsis thailandensis]|uniref:putative T7SS-secreted protein n=1 Tax=Amycolatopsis thailandensis TaxID=589330 RepID=UPI001FCA206F|nr:hypothetical protein [Amycolatopsis thailandensis]